jgi:BTB/POZ domain
MPEMAQQIVQQALSFLQSNQHQTLIIEEFEPDVFRQLIEYIHTGCVTLQPRTLLGELIKKLNLVPC